MKSIWLWIISEAEVPGTKYYYPFRMLMPGRVYAMESCITTTVLSGTTLITDGQMSGSGWSGAGGGVYLNGGVLTVYNTGNAGDGVNYDFQVYHNQQLVTIDLGNLDLTNLNPGNQVSVTLYDSSGAILYQYFTPPGAMFDYLNPIHFYATDYSRYRLEITYVLSGSGESFTLDNLDIHQEILDQTTLCGNPDYRFGFNGQEKDNEVKGIGNSLNFGARVYDSRVGVFLSIDPFWKTFSYQSPYCYAGNEPINKVDEEGKGPLTWVFKWLLKSRGRGAITVYGEAELKVGVVAGITLAHQTGNTYDNYGVLVFDVNYEVLTHPFSGGDATMNMDADIGLNVGAVYDWSSQNALRYWTKPNQTSVNVTAFDIVTGSDQRGFDFGIGVGVGISRTQVANLSAVALTYDQWSNVERNSKGWNSGAEIEVRNVTAVHDVNGKVVGYEGDLYTVSRRFFGMGRKVETNHNLRVFRKIYNEEDNLEIWQSSDYMRKSSINSKVNESIVVEPLSPGVVCDDECIE